MNRLCIVVVGFALSASAAQGAFVGVQYIQGNSAAATAALGQNAVTFRAYAVFDAAGAGAGLSATDSVLSVAFTNINTVGPATFFRAPSPPAHFFRPPRSSLFGANPTLRYDSYVTLGITDGDDSLASTITVDPTFWIDSTQIQGGWFGIDVPANIGAATANPLLNGGAGGFGTLLLQVTVLTNGGAGTFNGPLSPFFPVLAVGANGGASSVTSLITGSFSIFEQGPNGPIERTISIPTPGTLVLFGVAGLAAIRRRR